VAFTQIQVLKPISLGTLVLGLSLVIVAAAIVLRENLELKQALDSELTDLPDVEAEARQGSQQKHERMRRPAT
jgi:hypothetical protein